MPKTLAEPRVDATYDVSVPALTQDDIDTGVRCNPSSCPVARAILRMRGVYDVRVGAGIVNIKFKKEWRRFFIEANDKVIIRGWDEGKSAFIPDYVVHLRAPWPSEKLGTRNGGPHGSSKRSGTNANTNTRRPSLRRIDVVPPMSPISTSKEEAA